MPAHDLNQLIAAVDATIDDPSRGLPEPVFQFLTTVTPMINVDLLIRSTVDHVLLTWRDDGLYPRGWHVPGGVIRYKEAIADRIAAVAAEELGATVQFGEQPVAVSQIIEPAGERRRGHFISLLYACTLTSPLAPALEHRGGEPRAGTWAFHATCPDDILPMHRMYRRFWPA